MTTYGLGDPAIPRHSKCLYIIQSRIQGLIMPMIKFGTLVHHTPSQQPDRDKGESLYKENN
jgi:hypothetical protein